MYAIHLPPLASPAPTRCRADLQASESGTPAPPWSTLRLPAVSAVHPLRVPNGLMAVIECQQGCLWMTQQGLPSDHLATVGQRLYAPGPCTLYLGAQGEHDTQVRWVLLPRGAATPL